MDFEDLRQAIELADEIRDRVNNLSYTAYGALIGAMTDEWCAVNNENPAEFWKTISQVSYEINDEFGEFQL